MEATVRTISLAKVLRLTAGSRASLFLASVVYAVTLIYCLASYAAVEWPQYGFSYHPVSWFDAFAVCAALLVWSFVLPKRIGRPSSLFLIVIYVFLCVPGAIAMVGLERSSVDSYYLLFLSLTIGFALTCIVVRSFTWNSLPRESSPGFLGFLIIVWTGCLAVLLFSFGSILSFSGLDEIYLQRERGAASNLFEGYIQTYFGYVFSPALLAFGLVKRSYFLVVAGFMGAVILYMITAEKAVFIYPVFITALFMILRMKLMFLLSTSFVVITLSLMLFFSVFFYEDSSVAAFLAWYLGVRSLLVPGVFTVHYYNFFSESGYTLLSHISGVRLLVPPPENYTSHSRWPSIGHLVGEDYLGIPTLNANANFIAWDGVASFGVAGVFVALMLFAVFLVVLDKCARGIQPTISLLMLLPLSLTITNGSLFTALLSFGGLFLLLAFALAFKKGAHGRVVFVVNRGSL